MITSTIHDQTYELYSYDELGEATFQLAEQLLTTDQKFDRVVALAKGGLTYVRGLLDLLAIPDVSTIKIEFYAGVNDRQQVPIITQSLPVNIQDEKILIFDDIIDTGETLKLATTYLQQHGAQSITTACLLRKPWTTFQTDFFVLETEAWVIFPNELRESIELLSSNWRTAGDDDTAIIDQLTRVGFPPSSIEHFGP